jgi:DNA replication protein DnaC
VEQFDWQARPELKRAVMMRYFDSAFVEKAGGLLLIGPSGLGKTHLAIAVGTRMVQLGYSVRFLTVQQLANQVLLAPNRAAVAAIVQPLIRCQVLILDEFGYLTIDPQLGPVFYEIVSGRYRRGATIITSNKSLASWGEVVGGDTALMMAMLDRLLHHGDVFYLRGASYRLRGKEPVVLAEAAPSTVLPTSAGTSGTPTPVEGGHDGKGG